MGFEPKARAGEVGAEVDAAQSTERRPADRVDRLMRLQGSAGNSAVARLLRAPGSESAPSVADDVHGRLLAELGSGSPLPDGVRDDLQAATGADLGGVKVHRDAAADRLTGEFGAKAMTTGQDIFFGRGTYDPGSAAGMHLLAHEVAHTVQQPTAGVAAAPGVTVSDPHGADERAAEAAADRITSGAGPAASPAATVARSGARAGGAVVARVPETAQAAQRTSATTVEQAADALTMALAMPNPSAHREEIFRALLDVGDGRGRLAEAFEQAAGRPLERTLQEELDAKDWLRARSYLRHGRLRTADKLILASDGLGTDEDTLYRLMREARGDFAATEVDLAADFADLYAQSAKLFNLAAGSRIAGLLGEELSDWELDKARAVLAFGQVRPVDELRIATNRSGTDEDMIFSALRRAEPATITEEYRSYYGADAGGAWATLDGLLDDELSGDDLKKARAMVAGTWDTRKQIEMAVDGWGTDEAAIWDALEHLTAAERAVLQVEWREHRGIWPLLDDDLSDSDMSRAEGLILGGSDALSLLQQKGATSGSDIVDAIKMAKGPQLETYRTEWNSPTSGFRSWVVARTGTEHQAGINTILFGTPAAQLRWAVTGLGTDEDYIFHVLGGLTDEQKAAVAGDQALMSDLDGDLSTSDFNRVLDALRRGNLTLEQQVADTDARIERERSWLTDAFSNTSDALADEQREMHSTLDRARTDGSLSADEQRDITNRQAATAEALNAYIDARNEIEDLAANILTTAAAIVVSVCTAGAGSGVGAAMIASQLAAQAARVALISAVARVVATKVARGDRFDAFGADGAIAFGAGALDGVMNVFSAGAAQTLINPAFRAAGSAEARALAVRAWEQSVARRLVQSAVEGGGSGGIGAAFETSVNESTWKGGFEEGFRNVASSTGGGVLTGAAMSTAMTGATSAVEAATHPPTPGSPHPAGGPHGPTPHGPTPDGTTPGVAPPALQTANAAQIAGLPPDLQGRVPVHVDPGLAGGAVRVHYDVDADGLVSGIHLRVGAAADAATIGLHADVVRAMERYAGFSGRVRSLLRRIGDFVGVRGEPAPGTAAFEARLEVQKLPAIINERMSRLQQAGLDAAAQDSLKAEIADLEAQLVRHQRTVDQLDFQAAGRGFVAADARDQPLIDQARALGTEVPMARALGRTYADASLLERVRAEVEAGFAAVRAGQLTNESLGKVIGALGRAENDAQIHNALAELRNASRVRASGAVAATDAVHIGVSQARATSMGLDIAPIPEADTLYVGVDGNTHVEEVKGTANALVEKLRQESEQLNRMAAWQKAAPGRVAEVVIDTDAAWTKILGETELDAAGKVVRGSPHGLDRVIDSGLPMRIGTRRFTHDQLVRLRQAMLDDMRASGCGSAAEVRAGTAKMTYGQYLESVPTLDDLARKLGGLP